MNDTRFDPFDPQWFPMDSELAWWDSTNAPATTTWMTPMGDAHHRLTSRQGIRQLVRVLARVHSHRTILTHQLHRLDPRMPANPNSLIYRDLATLRLIDLGYPKNPSGRWAATPGQTRIMAIRLPKYRDITHDLTDLGVDPFTLAGMGPRPLRGARQYDRHNLICSELACRFQTIGMPTLGEAWSRFDLMFHDPTAGRGGPDLNVFRRDGLIMSVEATASLTDLRTKINRWNHLLGLHPDAGIMVVWLDCTPNGEASNGLRSILDHTPNPTGLMRTADARQWLADDQQLGLFRDGDSFAYTPYTGARRVSPTGEGRRMIVDTINRFGLDATQWTLKPPLTGDWMLDDTSPNTTTWKGA